MRSLPTQPLGINRYASDGIGHRVLLVQTEQVPLLGGRRQSDRVLVRVGHPVELIVVIALRSPTMKHQTQPKANTTTSTPTSETTASAAGSQLRLLPISEVMYRTSLSRSLLYSLVQQGKFPPPVKIGATSRWPSSQIDAWLHKLLKQAEEAQ